LQVVSEQQQPLLAEEEREVVGAVVVLPRPWEEARASNYRFKA
jgi:hypothetical protein